MYKAGKNRPCHRHSQYTFTSVLIQNISPEEAHWLAERFEALHTDIWTLAKYGEYRKSRFGTGRSKTSNLQGKM